MQFLQPLIQATLTIQSKCFIECLLPCLLLQKSKNNSFPYLFSSSTVLDVALFTPDGPTYMKTIALFLPLILPCIIFISRLQHTLLYDKFITKQNLVQNLSSFTGKAKVRMHTKCFQYVHTHTHNGLQVQTSNFLLICQCSASTTIYQYYNAFHF